MGRQLTFDDHPSQSGILLQRTAFSRILLVNAQGSWQLLGALGGTVVGAKWRIATVCLENVNKKLGFSLCVSWPLEIAVM